MIRLEKTIRRAIADGTQRVIKRYELELAETLEECFQLVNGSEADLIRIFNKGWDANQRAAHSPPVVTPGRVKTLLNKVSPEVRLLLETKSEEELIDIFREAIPRTKKKANKAGVSGEDTGLMEKNSLFK